MLPYVIVVTSGFEQPKPIDWALAAEVIVCVVAELVVVRKVAEIRVDAVMEDTPAVVEPAAGLREVEAEPLLATIEDVVKEPGIPAVVELLAAALVGDEVKVVELLLAVVDIATDARLVTDALTDVGVDEVMRAGVVLVRDAVVVVAARVLIRK